LPKTKKISRENITDQEKLGLSQNELIRHLRLEDEITQSRISRYELGTREPTLPTLLHYARSVGV